MSHPRRSLILAGGGLKVAWQAGVLQVWLDEAGVEFDHADGASGGLFNLAMWCQGMTGTQIADNWRSYQPLSAIDLNWSQFLKLYWASSLLEYDTFRRKILPAWGIDWDAINASERDATFNLYNFTRHELEVLPPGRMTEDLLISGVSLPIWFEPVDINGDLYTDAVWATDANLIEAVRRGADELWIIWTVDDSGEWNDGFVANYFHMVEASANGNFKMMLARIERNNQQIALGQNGEFGKHIEIKLLKGDVPLHYLINVSGSKMRAAVELGVEAARSWCEEHGLRASGVTRVEQRPTRLRFTETMKGYVTANEPDPLAGHEQRGERLEFEVTIQMDDVDAFVDDPRREARAEGIVRSARFGGRIERGIFNLFVQADDPAVKHMLYRLQFQGPTGPMTLSGRKVIRDDPGLDLWSDTTTLFTKIYEGHVGPDEEAAAKVLAAGVLRIHLLDFAKQLTTFRAEGESSIAETRALIRFGRLFLGDLWDTYGPRVFGGPNA